MRRKMTLVPVFVQRIPVALSVLLDQLAQSLDGSQNPFSLPLAARLAPRRRAHPHRQRVDLPQKVLRLGNPSFESVAADRQDAFDQRANRIPQQNPVRRKMDARLQAGRIHPGHGQVQFAFQPDLAGVFLVANRPCQRRKNLFHLLRRQPMRVVPQGALARNPDQRELLQPAEPAVKRRHRQHLADLSVTAPDQVLEHRATKRPRAVRQVSLDRFGSRLNLFPGGFQLRRIGFELLLTQLQKHPIHPAVPQYQIHSFQKPLLILIIFTSKNRLKCWTKVLLNCYDFAHWRLFFFVWRQNYNHPISGMAAFFAVYARTFLHSSPLQISSQQPRTGSI
jgi:hypothetical protein